MKIFLSIIFCLSLSVVNLFEAVGQVIIPIKDNLHKEQAFNLSEIASDIRYVPLETTDDCLLGNDCYVQYVDGQIFVMSGILYRFDGKTGRFLNRIGRIGQGPGEYNKSVHYAVNPATKRVYVLQFKTMLEYDYDGKFLRLLPAEDHNVGACCMMNSRQMIYANDAYNYTTNAEANQLFMVDLEKGKVIGRIPSLVDKKLRGALNLSSFDFFYMYKGQTYFKGSFQDQIYRIQPPQKKEVVYVCDRGYLKTDYDKKNAEIDPRNRMRGIQIQNIVEMDKYLFISYVYEQKGYQGVFNKQNHSFINASGKDRKTGIVNDLTGGPALFIYPFQMSPENTIVSVYNAGYLLDNKENYQLNNPRLPSRQAEWSNVLNSLTEDSNPVVAIITLKADM